MAEAVIYFQYPFRRFKGGHSLNLWVFPFPAFLPSCLWCCAVLLHVLPPAVCWDSDHNGPVKPVSGCPRQLLVAVDKNKNQQDVDTDFI